MNILRRIVWSHGSFTVISIINDQAFESHGIENIFSRDGERIFSYVFIFNSRHFLHWKGTCFSSLSYLLFNKTKVIILLNKKWTHISDEILWFYDVEITHTQLLDKLRNLLVVINYTDTKYIIMCILKDTSDLSNFISIENPETLRVLSIYQYFRK